MVLLLVTVFGATLHAQSEESRAKHFYSQIARPLTLIDLLRNFKIAMDGDLLLRDDFYTEDNLKKFTGGGRVVRHAAHPNAKNRGDVVDFGSMVKDAQYDGRPWRGLGIRFTQRFKDGQDAVTAWDVTIGALNPVGFSQVEAIFGTGWEPPEPTVPSPHGPLRSPSTHPHAYARIVYRSASLSLRREMTFSFSSDGNLGNASFALRSPLP